MPNNNIEKKLKIKPNRNGFIKYTNFDSLDDKTTISKKNKKYKFAFGFGNENITENANYLTETILKFSEFKNKEINGIFVKNSDIFFASKDSIFSYNTDLNIFNEYENLNKFLETETDDTDTEIKKGFISIGLTKNNELITLLNSNGNYSFIIGTEKDFSETKIISLSSIIGNTDDIYDILFLSSGECVILKKDFTLYKINTSYSKYIKLDINDGSESISEFIESMENSTSQNVLFELKNNKIFIKGANYNYNPIIIEYSNIKFERINSYDMQNEYQIFNDIFDSEARILHYDPIKDLLYYIYEIDTTKEVHKISYSSESYRDDINTIMNIDEQILNTLNKEKELMIKNKINSCVPYSIKGKIKNIDTLDEYVYKEFGTFGQKPDDFDIFVTKIGTFLVNKEDRTKCFWATNNPDIEKISGNKKRYENIRFEYIKIGVGFDYVISESNRLNAIEIHGTDQHSYIIGDRKVSEDKYVFFSTPFPAAAISDDEYYNEYEWINSYEFESNSFHFNPEYEHDLIYNDQMSKTELIDSQDYDQDTNKRLNNCIVCHMPGSLIVKDSNRRLWSKGLVNGFLNNIKYTNNFIPVNMDLNIKNIKNIVTNNNRTFIVTENELYVAYEKTIYDGKNKYEMLVGIDKEDEVNDFYFKEIQLPFKASLIKNIKLSNLCTFVLLSDGKLYACGNNKNKELPLKGNIRNFELIKENVEDIWVNENSSIIKTKENNAFKYYGINNNYGVIYGLTKATKTTSYVEIPDFDDIDIKNIILLKDSLIAYTNKIVYAVGNNAKNTLGTSADVLQSFTNVFETSSNDEIIFEVITNEKYTIIHTRNKTTDEDSYYVSGNLSLIENKTTYSNITFKKIYFEYDDFSVRRLFSLDDNDFIVCLKSRDNKYYVKSNSSVNKKEITGEIEKAVKINDEYYIMYSNSLYRYSNNINELSKVIGDIYDFFYEKEIIKIIKNDMSFGSIVFDNTIHTEIKNEVNTFKECINCTGFEFDFIDKSEESRKIQKIRFIFNDFAFDYEYEIDVSDLEKGEKRHIEFKSIEPFNEISNIEFVYEDEESEPIDLESVNECISNIISVLTIYNNHGTGAFIRKFKDEQIEKIYYDEPNNYIESYYGFENNKKANRSFWCIKNISSTNDNNAIRRKTISDIKNNNSVEYSNITKGFSNNLMSHPIFDYINKQYEDVEKFVGSFELEILPIKVKRLENLVFVKDTSDSDEDKEKIKSIIK